MIRFPLFLLLPLILYARVSSSECIECHQGHVKSFENSHHALAMQKATLKSVLGDFNNARFLYNGITSTFFKENSVFIVRTDGHDGRLRDYEIAYTFGVYPLQQYMVKFPNGSIQVLDIAWDSRTKQEGGQRWFHLHPDDNVTAGDELHWTGPNLNWNFMCADCHSTNLKKNYDPKSRLFATTYDNISLTCASCHGEGSEHRKWAKNPKAYKGKYRFGLHIDLKKNRWHIDSKSGRPILEGKIDRTEVQMCAQCHARRAQLDNEYSPGKAFEEHYLLSQLEEELYFSNGLIKDEVYEYGSFKQSKMYEAGVTCSDCHDVHSLDREVLNDSVCSKCHQESQYASKKHHHHDPQREGGSCISCHMPARIYMGVDSRNDHSFSIPRPDLSVNNENPNACNLCHVNKDAKWATKKMKQWYGDIPIGKQNFAHVFEALHVNSQAAPQFLYDLLLDDQPTLAKATAIGYLGQYPSRQTYVTTLQMLKHVDSDIRLSALRSLEAFSFELRVNKTVMMLDDTSKAVRMEAARQLSVFSQEGFETAEREKIDKGIKEYEASLLYNSDRASSQTALGTLYANLGNDKNAKSAFEEALSLDPSYLPAIVNYVYFLQVRKDEQTAYNVLQQALDTLGENAQIYFTLGLWYQRNGEPNKALNNLKKAASMEKENVRIQYAYALAVAQNNVKAAIDILESSLALHTGDIQTIYALAYYYERLGMLDKSKDYRKRGKRLESFTPKIRK